MDTGSLYEPTATRQSLEVDKEDNSAPTSRTSQTPPPTTEVIEKEVVVETTPKVLSVELDAAQESGDGLLVLPSTPIDDSEDRSSEPTLEPSENHISSGSKDDPIVLSPLPTVVRESPRSVTEVPPSDKLHPIVVEHDAQLPQSLDDTLSGFSSSELHPTCLERSILGVETAQLCDPGSPEPATPKSHQHSERVLFETSPTRRFGDAPLGVLVTRGDQCPSKFVVSGISSNPTAEQEISTQDHSQTRHALPWIETVIEYKADIHSEEPASEGSQSTGLKSDIERGFESSTGIQVTSELSSQRPLETIGVVKRPGPRRQPYISETSEGRVQSDVTSEASLKTNEASTAFLTKQWASKRKLKRPDVEMVAQTDSASKLLPPVQLVPTSAEAVTIPGLKELDPNIFKLADEWTTKVSCSLDILAGTDAIGTATKIDPRTSVFPSSEVPPTLRFTDNNRAESTLTTAEVQQLVQIFVRDAIAILPRNQPAPAKAYPAGVVMWQSLQKFYKWYITAENIEKGSAPATMMFELLDVHWQPEHVFYLPKTASQHDFKELKQSIWDLFWISARSNGVEKAKPFRILITPAPNTVDGAKFGHLTTAYSPTPNALPPLLPRQPSSQSSFESMIQNFHDLKPNKAHRNQVNRPPSLTLDTPQVTLEVEGAKTPQLLWDFLQKSGKTPDSAHFPPLNSSSTRPESLGNPAGRIELLHPPLERSESNMTAVFQPSHQPSRSPLLRPFTNNIPPQPSLFPPGPVEAPRNSTSGNQIQILPQPPQPSRNRQLPSPRPSPPMTETAQMPTLRPQPATADKSYAANTARPLFSTQTQKGSTLPRTLLPAAQNIRVSNTAQQAPDVQDTSNAPVPTQPKHKEIQPKPSSALPQTSRTPREKKWLRDAALRMVNSFSVPL